MKLCWLIPDDRGGGVASVALSCCRQAAKAGHETTLLMLLSPTGWIDTSYNFQLSSLGLSKLAQETPAILLQWLKENPQDVLFLNGCEEADAVISYLPPSVKCVYIVHDTAPRYWRVAVSEEDNLEAIVAVSQTVASQFQHRLKKATKLSVVLNGCVFPKKPALNVRKDELIFLGGDKPIKGAFDLLKLWEHLVKFGFTGKLHWFGNVSPDFRARLDELPNCERVHIYNRVKRELIFSTAASAKLLLMLSRVEPFGMATIEAMSMGCIPVAWDIDTGTKEIVTANKTGLFAPLGNMQVLASQVLYACENYQAFSTDVIEHARTNFDEAVMWKGYASLLKRISALEPINRSKNSQQPVAFKPSIRLFQLLPTWLRSAIKNVVGRSPRLGYWLRDLRGL